MFEDSLVESRISSIPTEKRWTVVGSVGVQCLLAAIVIAVPLLHPAAMPIEVTPPRVIAPVLSKPPVPVRVRQVANASSAASMPTTAAPSRPLLFPTLRHNSTAAAPPIANVRFGNGFGNPLSEIATDGTGNSPAVTVRPERPTGPVHVSSGVTAGMLLAPIQPIYPAIARSARVQGTVVVEAIITRTGTIESLKVISGPEMLRGAAVDAIRSARYRPFTLNGQPTDVETTITVNFRMDG